MSDVECVFENDDGRIVVTPHGMRIEYGLHSDHPVLGPDGSVSYSFPERVPESLKEAAERYIRRLR